VLTKRTLDIRNFERLCAFGESLTCGLGDVVRSSSSDVRSLVPSALLTPETGAHKNGLLTSVTPCLLPCYTGIESTGA
jgi:hypothetical protein